MKKLIFIILCGGLLASCSESEKDAASNLPPECKETFRIWDTLLEKREKSGKYSSQEMAKELENRNFYEKRISTETTDRTRQKNACEPISDELRKEIKRLESTL